jgi:hypothetical protein
MRKLAKLTVLLCIEFSSAAMAKSLEGIVTREDGKPIANATVQIVDFRYASTDLRGQVR